MLSLATTLPLAALDMALQQHRPPAGLVHHSDRGSQYASEAYRQRLAQAGLVSSMSRRGNCHDHAAMESFWSSLNDEFERSGLPGLKFAELADIKYQMFATWAQKRRRQRGYYVAGKVSRPCSGWRRSWRRRQTLTVKTSAA